MNAVTDWTPEAAEATALTEAAALAEYKRTHPAALPDGANDWITEHPEIAVANGPKILKWDVKCDDCKVTIRETTNVKESYAGGTCDACKTLHEAANTRFLAAVDPYQVGAIVSHSWGYEQTNVDFFRIVKRSGHWVTIQRMTAVENSNGPTSMTGTVVPGEVRADAKPTRRKLRYGTHEAQKGQPIGFPIKSYGWASVWDGQPEHVSHYG